MTKPQAFFFWKDVSALHHKLRNYNLGVYLVFVFTDKHPKLRNQAKYKSAQNAVIQRIVKKYETRQNNNFSTHNPEVVGSNPAPAPNKYPPAIAGGISVSGIALTFTGNAQVRFLLACQPRI